jgi:hypothetical protein
LNVIPEGTPGDKGIIVFVVTLEGLTPRRCGAPEKMCLNIVIRDLSILFNVTSLTAGRKLFGGGGVIPSGDGMVCCRIVFRYRRSAIVKTTKGP